MTSVFVSETDMELQTLLAACQAADDPFPALSTLADWLEVRNDPRSKCVRIGTRLWQLEQQYELTGRRSNKDEGERLRLGLRVIPECYPVMEAWLGIPIDWIATEEKPGFHSAPLLGLEVKAVPTGMPRLYDALQAGWVWKLSVTGTVVDDILAELLPKSGPIRCISFLENEALRNGDLAMLGQVPHLRELDLYGTRISDEGLRLLAPIRTLREVSVMKTRVTAAGCARASAYFG